MTKAKPLKEKSVVLEPVLRTNVTEIPSNQADLMTKLTIGFG